MAYNAAYRAASIPPGTAVHALYVRDGQIVGDSWQHASDHGTGRSNASIDAEARQGAVEISVDLTERLATNRLRELINALTSSVPRTDVAIFFNALAVAEQSPSAPDVALTGAAVQIDALLRSAVGDASLLLPSSLAILQRMQMLRDHLAVDASSAAVLMLAARIPTECALACDSDRSGKLSTLEVLLTQAASGLRTGDYLSIHTLVASAALAGYIERLDFLSDQLLASAERQRDEALHAPPDPLAFSKLLYRVPPYAVAALLICRWVSDLDLDHRASKPPWNDRATQAEEIAVRASAGLAHQYFYRVNNELSTIRDSVLAARATGDHITADLLISDGVMANYWPESYQGFFDGTGREPAVDPRRLSNETAADYS